MKELSFHGVTGEVKLNANRDRIGEHDVRLMVPEGYSLIARVSMVDEEVVTVPNAQIVYIGGGTDKPDDGTVYPPEPYDYTPWFIMVGSIGSALIAVIAVLVYRQMNMDKIQARKLLIDSSRIVVDRNILLGRGASSTVYQAKLNNQVVAIKLFQSLAAIPEAPNDDPEALAEWRTYSTIRGAELSSSSSGMMQYFYLSL